MKKFFTVFIAGSIAFATLAASGEVSLRRQQQLAANGRPANTSLVSRRYELPKSDNIQQAKTPAVINPFNLNRESSDPYRPVTRTFDEGSTIYGYLAYSSDWSLTRGFYELNSDGYELIGDDPVLQKYSMYADDGWYMDGKVCGFAMQIFSGMLFNYDYFEIDFKTNQIVRFEEYDVNSIESYFVLAVYDEGNDKIFGIAEEFESGKFYWASANAYDPGKITLIKAVDYDICHSLCYNPSDGYLYGVNGYNQFVRITPEGNQTVISVYESADLSNYVTGLVYSPVENLFYWNAVFKDNSSDLYTISPDGEFNAVQNYYFDEEFTYFFTTDEFFDADKPMAPVFDSIDFVNGSLSGQVKLTMPLEYVGGTALNSDIDLTVKANGTEYYTSTVKPGSSISVDLTFEERGFYEIQAYVTVDGKNSAKTSVRQYLGNDTPTAPKNVTLSSTEITWDAVKTGVNGGYVDVDAMTYNVYLNGEFICNTTETTVPVDLGEDHPLESYTATVSAECNGYVSMTAYSNVIVSGNAYTPPMYFVPTPEEFALMTVVDVNNDGRTWQFDAVYKCAMVNFTTSDMSWPMDDYLYLPPVKIDDPEKYYKFSYEVGLRGHYTGDKIEVVYGTSTNPDDIVDTIIEPFEPTVLPGEGEWNYLEGMMKVSEPGIYYIALHCLSDHYAVGMLAKNFMLADENITDSSPKEVTDLTVTPGQEGALYATVEFTMPTETLFGTNLTVETLSATISVEGLESSTQIKTGKPGETIKTDIVTQQGTNVINVVVDAGNYSSPITSMEVYTGIYAPSTPQNVNCTVGEDMLSAHITWDKVTTPYNPDGYLNPENITYSVILLVDYGISSVWETVAEGLTDTSYTFSIDPTETQQQYILGVRAVNEAGDNGYINLALPVLGTPYNLPFIENLENGVVATDPWYAYSAYDRESYDATWTSGALGEIDETLPDPERFVFIGYTNKMGSSKGLLGVPCFSTLGSSSVTLSFNLLTGPMTANVRLFAKTYGLNDYEEIATIPGNQGTTAEYSQVSYELPASLTNKPWVQLFIEADFSNVTQICALGSFKVTGDNAGVNSVFDNSFISTTGKSILFKGLDGKNYQIYSVDGKTVAEGKVTTDNFTQSVAEGYYIVKCGNITKKVVVK
ncbi:MAG: fibronectin type III domain-containing protein [Muribaculaceae bacterium]|nr:fibronectin type III domain-containing protein [Muribaculaceae bacterium]